MTLAEGLDVLKTYYPTNRKVRRAIRIVLNVLSPIGEKKMSAEERLDEIKSKIAYSMNGYDPFTKRRVLRDAVWRQCIYKLMREEGYTLHSIGNVAGYDHSTIYCGIQACNDALSYGDWLYKGTWEKLNQCLKDDWSSQEQNQSPSC